MRYKFLVKTNPTSPEQDEEYNKWYNEVHLAQVLELPGFVLAERFVFADTQTRGTPDPSHRYLAIYDVETDDLAASLTALRERAGTPRLVISDAVDLANSRAEIFVALADGPMHAKPAHNP